MASGVYPEAFQFPGGEWHLRNIPEFPTDEGRVTLIADVRGADSNDLIKAALWANLAGRANFSFEARKDLQFVLMLPYLPAARADRGVPLGSQVYANIVNAMWANQVIGLDPHSPVITKQLQRLTVADHHDLVVQAIGEGKPYDALICPDKGAVARTEALAAWLGVDVYYAEKHRDFDTGKLSGITVPTLPKGRFLVADDICDGGGTFLGLAEATGKYPEDMGLWVTHGIFSGKADDLRGYYRNIYTTDSHPGSHRVGVATTIVPCFHAMFNATHF